MAAVSEELSFDFWVPFNLLGSCRVSTRVSQFPLLSPSYLSVGQGHCLGANPGTLLLAEVQDTLRFTPFS